MTETTSRTILDRIVAATREDLIERANRYQIPQLVQPPPNPKKSP